MSLEVTFNRLKDVLPQPLAVAFSALIQEHSGFAKLNRLIDAYEVSIKLLSAAAVQTFYSLGLAREFPYADVTIREEISRPSIGH